jgi:hypothetical protein
MICDVISVVAEFMVKMLHGACMMCDVISVVA